VKSSWWRSFQARSVVASLVVSLLVWSGFSLWTMYEAGNERSRRYDGELQISAETVIRAFPKALVTHGETTVFDVAGPPGLWASTNDFNYQVWTADRRLVSRAASTPAQALNPTFAPGFSNATIDGGMWRVYTVSDSTGAIQVQTGMNMMQRRELAMFAMTEGLAGLLLLLVPLMLGLLAAAAWTARPLRRWRNTVAARSHDDDSPLPEAGLPSEAVLLVKAFNEVLQRSTQAREAQQRFVGDAAHELRTPLAALRVQAQVALRLRDEAQRQQALARLVEGIDRTTRVAEQLLDLARMDSLRGNEPALQPGSIDVEEVASHTARGCLALADRRRVQLDVRTVAAGPPLRAQGNAELLGIALRNVIDNALRYTPEGGRVQIESARVGQQVQINVTDSGPGLDAQQREQALVPFVRLQPRGDEAGSGLGLSIVQRVCALQNVVFELLPAPAGAGLQARFTLIPALAA
jgi:signal transduction histidine kinase